MITLRADFVAVPAVQVWSQQASADKGMERSALCGVVAASKTEQDICKLLMRRHWNRCALQTGGRHSRPAVC